MSVLRLVRLFETRVVPRDIRSTQVVNGRVDVRSLIEMYDAWTPLADDQPEVRPLQPSRRQLNVPAPTDSTTQPTTTPAVVPATQAAKVTTVAAPFILAVKALQESKDQAIASTPKHAATAAHVPGAISAAKTLEYPKDQAITSTLMPVATAIHGSTAIPVFKTLNHPKTQATTSAPRPATTLIGVLTTVPAVKTLEHPKDQGIASTPTADATSIYVPTAVPVFKSLNHRKTQAIISTPKPATSAIHIPTAIRVPTSACITTATRVVAPTPQSNQASPIVARQHPTARPHGPKAATSRLFSYENDPKYLQRRAEAKLRRFAAAVKSSSPLWGI
ncbi:hypothetical protein P3T76_011063 [Phytophthora citrophthora]|uniref:Uncharacterized protein n=1 Tax=Phytophthora citrophthora TaxID=4793 RepID=A0AAD9G9W7_9STRA|nr:hypothetical protein P3T76_011063 [Phytophthora citrophthora]